MTTQGKGRHSAPEEANRAATAIYMARRVARWLGSTVATLLVGLLLIILTPVGEWLGEKLMPPSLFSAAVIDRSTTQYVSSSPNYAFDVDSPSVLTVPPTYSNVEPYIPPGRYEGWARSNNAIDLNVTSLTVQVSAYDRPVSLTGIDVVEYESLPAITGYALSAPTGDGTAIDYENIDINLDEQTVTVDASITEGEITARGLSQNNTPEIVRPVNFPGFEIPPNNQMWFSLYARASEQSAAWKIRLSLIVDGDQYNQVLAGPDGGPFVTRSGRHEDLEYIRFDGEKWKSYYDE